VSPFASSADWSTRRVGDLDTPVAVVEVRRLETNLARMAALAGSHRIAHRPHAKTHKTREIAERQRAHGATGLTVAKVGEAEAFAAAGFDDLFIAYPLVGRRKYERLLPLLEVARIRFEVDSFEGAEMASRFFADRGLRVEVVVSVDGGAGRSGVASVASAVRLGQQVADLPGLELVGVMSYGNAYSTGDPAEQRTIGLGEGAYAVEVAAAFRSLGLPTRVVTVGSTPTVRHVVEVDGITEIRAGNYVFYDLKQVSLAAAALEDCSLTVIATVVSHARPGRYIVDAGLKALAGEDYGWGTWGRIQDRPELAITRATEEHGIIDLPPGAEDPRWLIGQHVRIIPNHACGTVNMHDVLAVVDGDDVIDWWPVIGRGRFR
jgi:D-serine deaminase-like pyridoxal phosphate-dependent protein